MFQEVMIALNKLEQTLRVAIRKDIIAEMEESFDNQQLKSCDEAWAQHRTARVDLEELIHDICSRVRD